ncbi:AraC family transcriptional regulator [Paenibacillus sp. UNC451MF]|uniref:AraC family transcriptional regulator n=1 Tax=Paenibacillus sp. UNC451MF TaxID=1449063 RepID=UPI00048AB5A2|nr:helix-turn-helix domain-containing protein [Paenibacillus sp. UNC451MF]
MDVKLQSLFRPIQANGRRPSNPYREWLPAPILQPYVSCYWASEPDSTDTVSELNPQSIDRVIPDGCTDILFEQNLKDNSYSLRFCGMFDSPFAIAYDSDHPVRKLGVRFFPGGAHLFLKASLSDFTNCFFPLDSIGLWMAGDMGERIFAEKSVESRIRIIEQHLIALLQMSNPLDDHRMKNMLYRIFDSGGSLPVTKLAESECLSPRQMNRKFHQWLGMGPKRFSEIVRFQAVVSQIRQNRREDWTTLALQHGFFDQAHLIHVFKRFYGETPSAAAEEYCSVSVLYNTAPS